MDDSNLAQPVVNDPSPDVSGGVGMKMVDKLSADWGVREYPATGSKTVWAVVVCDGVDAMPCAAVSE
ncbi:hypothetical protein AB0L41_00980 [Amycolatopsis mediterranei]|uniref:hypothetical protein n=1 Tax=Amycolatopsis mediterranei TaxID=33910 RepID=UPI0034496A57